MHVLGYRIPSLVFVGLVVAGVSGGALAAWGGRREWTRVRIASSGGGVFAIVMVLSVTLAPSSSLGTSPGCALRWPSDLFIWTDDQRILNVAMYAPLGVVLALSARTGRLVIAGLAALAGLSLAVELLQSLPIVGRSCDTIDVIDNILGALVGTVVGLPFGAVALRARDGPDERSPSP